MHKDVKKVIKKLGNFWSKIRKQIEKISLKKFLLVFFSAGFIFAGIAAIWVSTLQLPDFKSFNQAQIQSSTKIYDRTGTILLYDIHQDIKRTVIPSEDMGVNIKNAVVAIEDSEFYQHNGIRISSIIRGTIWAKLTGKKVQGGSTITQQVIKNTLLNSNRTITRKIKEWILALKLEKVMTKDQILTLYLNEAPYGGNIYGIEEASKSFFGKEPIDLTLAESAYLAAIPNAPTHYSPYGKYRQDLEDRKNLVLKRMLDLKFITNTDYNKAMAEKVTFLPAQPLHIAAPHFVFFIKDYLEKKYGQDVLNSGGLKVITTLDYNLQKKVEEITLAQSKINEKNFNGKNAAVVVIDPKTGQILSMVGSRDYFDKSIDGNFNVATAARQPGSSFKPIVYAQAFKEGYTENTNLFDVKTEFSTFCTPAGIPLPGHSAANCYEPRDFDNKYRGPMKLKDALAQSINIVAIKLLYLVGIPDALKMAHDLGITTLNDPTRYGLSLVVGGGETTLLDMTSAYSVFANDGVRNPYQSILSVEDSSGNVLEQYKDNSYRVLDSNVARTVSDSLDDNVARTPTFGPNSVLNIPGREVAVKTGTTNNDKDAWTIGYTPSIAVGVWVGNNDNTPMKGGGSTLAGPIWNGVIEEALKNLPVEYFGKPNPIDKNTTPPILRGFWQGGNTFTIDTVSGGLATQYTPENTKKEISITNVHSILYWIDKNNPLSTVPTNPENDPQYKNWEYGVQKWWNNNKSLYKIVTAADEPTFNDPIHTTLTTPSLEITGLTDQPYNKDQPISISINSTQPDQIKKIDIFVNNTYIRSLNSYPYSISFIPSNISDISTDNTIKVVGYETSGDNIEATAQFQVN